MLDIEVMSKFEIYMMSTQLMVHAIKNGEWELAKYWQLLRAELC